MSKKKSKKEEKKNSKFLFFILIGLIVLISIYFLFFNNKTGDDSITENFSQEFFNNFRENSSNDSVSEFVSVNVSDNESKSSSGSSPGVQTIIDSPPFYERPEIKYILNDTDIFELENGYLYTFNPWDKGTCFDEGNQLGYLDYCEGSVLFEYFVENDTCNVKGIDCMSFLEFYSEGTEIGCYNGFCTFKDGGMNLTDKGYLLSEDVYWDKCLSEDVLREYSLSPTNSLFYSDVNCSDIYGENAKCSDGACIIVVPEILEETNAIDDDDSNFYNQGTCADKTGFYEDYCDSGVLFEYIVDPDNSLSCLAINTTCPGICMNGACIAYDLDMYSDSPYEVEASCIDETGTTKDLCNCLDDGNTCYYLREAILKDGKCSSKIVDCRTVVGENYYCSSGKCIPEVVGRPTR